MTLPRVDSAFLDRLRRRDDRAWTELWEVFGPVLERMVTRFARRCFTPETVRDISQETLLRLAREIHRFDPGRGTRFSTWLFRIAHHVVCGEFAHRRAAKRNRGLRPGAIDPAAEPAGSLAGPPEEFERSVFRAKVYRAMRRAEERLDFLPFEIYKARILRGMRSKEIAKAVGVSEATVSRHLRKARAAVREAIREVVAEYSFLPEEREEIGKARLAAEDAAFDEALAEICAREEESRKEAGTISRTVFSLAGRRG